MRVDNSRTQCAGRQTETAATEADLIRAAERERLRGLVAGDVSAVRDLHADDFQLINPSGSALSKELYLGGVASGAVNYLVWEPGAIEVRLYGEAAVIRYQSQLAIIFNGQPAPLRPMWHTDVYEKRDGRWQGKVALCKRRHRGVYLGYIQTGARAVLAQVAWQASRSQADE